jgi:hypothetical protein
MTCGRRTEPPAPSPEMVTASRHHLNKQYAHGVNRLLWDLDKRPMPDADAVMAVITASRAGERRAALDIGAALVLLQAMRQDLDCLEADLYAVARANGLDDESLAAVLELPDAAAAAARRKFLDTRRELSSATLPAARGEPAGSREAARVRGRARQTAGRAAAAARRRQELGQGRPQGPVSGGADADLAAADAAEPRIQAAHEAEPVTLG